MRLIDADKLSNVVVRVRPPKKATEAYKEAYTNGAANAIRAMIAIENSQDTVDVEHVQHGKWLKIGDEKSYFECSVCGFERDIDTNFGKALSCPNCTAKTDGKDSQKCET
jgi:Zn finger protein HypA/HybF involved in hydrogenase expression